MPWIWTDVVVQPKQRKRDIRFGTWENFIKINLQETGWGHGLVLSGSEKGREAAPVNSVTKIRVI